ncbi:Predicted thiol-disulfide oxidoreductase YuxK, DCC family [Belliella buryatensis]|uniref:Predicted thiol-disulfide oxidoreductase YuxK, DCC family n=1 Tax=Belliella buryatensis TaxID=1500549 RepID=A0A239FC06_9BACT|nr:thiol-disulfide oxidoreductase DCC family protein [Belliella buryatensis]SNS54357.1 Predicted thiol-disulfide oxidoreductase YuxK, DCC family [Belliella buryatensis]
MSIQDKYKLVLFDGVCNLCNNAVDFIIRKDKKNRFKVGALQDKQVKEILEDYTINSEYLDSLVLIDGDKVYYKSTAALLISKNLSGFWPMLYGFIIFPKILRDPIYDWIARNRYKWFGKKETCRLPTEEEKSKFIQ